MTVLLVAASISGKVENAPHMLYVAGGLNLVCAGAVDAKCIAVVHTWQPCGGLTGAPKGVKGVEGPWAGTAASRAPSARQHQNTTPSAAQSPPHTQASPAPICRSAAAEHALLSSG
jgi:hypothetical protein